MRINENIRKSIIFIGIMNAKGGFEPYGTAFIGLWNHEGINFPYVITAKHLVDDMRATKCRMVARVYTKSGEAELGEIHDQYWNYHPSIPKCDIAVAYFTASFDKYSIMGVDLNITCLTKEYVQTNDIGCGDEVITIGLLLTHYGKTQNTPIVRTGNIAAMPEEPVNLGNLGEHEVYLIESRSIGGLSGSPVYLNTPPHRIAHGKIVDLGGHQREYLMGVNIGLFETKANQDIQITTSEEKRENFLERMSAGIAVVVPIQRVLEIINSETNIKKRIGAIEKNKTLTK